MPYITTKKNKQIFNLKSKVNSNFESDRYEIIKLYDLDMEKIQALGQYSNIPGTILYNPWSTTFHLYTNGMDLTFGDGNNLAPKVFYNKHGRTAHVMHTYNNMLGVSGISSSSFPSITSSDLFSFFRKNYPNLIDYYWTKITPRSKGFMGVNYECRSPYMGYAFSDKPVATSYLFDLSIDFILACFNINSLKSTSYSSSYYRTHLANSLGFIKRILISEQMKSNRKFSDLLSILPEENILHHTSKFYYLGLNTNELISFFLSLIQNPKFTDQIDLLNKSNFSSFTFQDFKDRLISGFYSPKLLEYIDLDFISTKSNTLHINQSATLADYFSNANSLLSRDVIEEIQPSLESFDCNPIIYWQPFRFDIASKWRNYESFNINFGYRNSKYDLPYLYLNSTVYNASNRDSCSVLMIPRNPTGTINIDPVCDYYS